MAVLAFAGSRAEAQGTVVPATWDHYKLYLSNPIYPYTGPNPVLLNDQFGSAYHQVQFLDRWMNPVEKALPEGGIFGINEPFLHYTWWRIDAPPPQNQWTVAVTNQFGDQMLNVGDPVYLLNPALKNQTGTLPVRNHYKCYLCDGLPVNKQVLMTDQFDQWGAQVLFPRYFCNPTEKTVGPVPGGQTYPIVDPAKHYVCYEYNPPDAQPFTALITDQFVQDRTVDLHPSQWICVPSIKQTYVPTRRDTWGKLKQLYR
jgi:hypothetical protein